MMNNMQDDKCNMEMVEQQLAKIVDYRLIEESMRRQIKELEVLQMEVKHTINIEDNEEQSAYTEKIKHLKNRLEAIVMKRMGIEEMLSDMELSPNARRYAKLRYVEGHRVGYIMSKLDLSASTCRRLRMEVLSAGAH